MLTHLHVRNYALIRELDLDLYSGLSVLTGETGAGKSIILGALRLILGDRADSKVLFDEDVKCVVEGVFNIKNYGLKSFFKENDLDFADTTIVRREILDSKSRAFINDTPVKLNVLKELGDLLVDIHSQHETLELRSRDFQFDIVDAYADTFDLREIYQTKYNELRSAESELERLSQTEEQSKADLEFHTFQLEELIAANLKAGELVTLEEEFNLLSRSEEIRKALSLADSMLNGERGVLEMLGELKHTFDPLEKISDRWSVIAGRIRSSLIELDDLASEISGSGSDFDEERLSEVSQRLDMLNTLMRKHRVQTEVELIDVRDRLESRLSDVNSLEDKIKQAQSKAEKLKKEALKLAGELAAKRENHIQGLVDEIEDRLSDLSMADSKIRFEFVPSDLNKYGATDLQVMFRTNLGTPFEILHKAASGGEMARLMLSLKSIVATRKKLPTIIFDEIDTGVSGEVASKMGTIMRGMGSNMQVISITHLPQVAGKGEHHYNVFKESTENKTTSFIRELNPEERLHEIAKMLSGDKVEQSALETARGLIQMN